MSKIRPVTRPGLRWESSRRRVSTGLSHRASYGLPMIGGVTAAGVHPREVPQKPLKQGETAVINNAVKKR